MGGGSSSFFYGGSSVFDEYSEDGGQFGGSGSAAAASSLRLSLDPPIQTLADATFELLRAQYWFDAILLIDDSIVSDLFARRLKSLCRAAGVNSNNNYHPGGKSGGGEGGGRNRRNYHQQHQHRRSGPGPGFHSDQDQLRLDSPLYGDGFAWSNFRRNGLKKGLHRLQTLVEEVNNRGDDGVGEGAWEGMQSDGFGGEDQQRRRAVSNDDNFYEDTRKSREASLLDVWKNLIVIRLSRSLNQTQVCLFVYNFYACLFLLIFFLRFSPPPVLPSNGGDSDHPPAGGPGAHRLGHQPAGGEDGPGARSLQRGQHLDPPRWRPRGPPPDEHLPVGRLSRGGRR